MPKLAKVFSKSSLRAPPLRRVLHLSFAEDQGKEDGKDPHFFSAERERQRALDVFLFRVLPVQHLLETRFALQPLFFVEAGIT